MYKSTFKLSKGNLIISGCGLNSYGSDCKGVCSIRADKMCRGILMCTSLGCTCPAGLTGPLCNKGWINKSYFCIILLYNNSLLNNYFLCYRLHIRYIWSRL